MPHCISCREEKHSVNSDGICYQCAQHAAEEADREKLRNIVLTTALEIPKRSIDASLGVVATEAAVGLSIFKDIANNWRDFVGGRSATVQNALRDARKSCLDELRKEAHKLKADAVIAIDLNYNEISTGSGGILFVAASGTAVKLSE
jgi:uncharacterized protein YbjQ (UPF0145 family)